MKRLRDRLARLEATRAVPSVSVVFLCDGSTGEPVGAILRGGGGCLRTLGESVAEFEQRALSGG